MKEDGILMTKKKVSIFFIPAISGEGDIPRGMDMFNAWECKSIRIRILCGRRGYEFLL